MLLLPGCTIDLTQKHNMASKLKVETYWDNVKKHFMTHRNEWVMESENLGNELALWLAQEHGCMIRGRKHLYFCFADDKDAEMFVLKFSGKN